MNDVILKIPLLNLALAFIPVAAVIFVFYKWRLDIKNACYAVFRMLGQLMLIGYLLTYIFAAESAWIVLLVLMVMVSASASLSALAVIRMSL